MDRSVVLSALRSNAFKKTHDLGLAVATVPTERPDRRELPGLRPPRDRLRVDAEEGGDLGGGKQRLARRLVPLHPGSLLTWVTPRWCPQLSLSFSCPDCRSW